MEHLTADSVGKQHDQQAYIPWGRDDLTQTGGDGNLNPSQFLSGIKMGDLEHNCLDFINYQTKVRYEERLRELGSLAWRGGD